MKRRDFLKTAVFLALSSAVPVRARAANQTNAAPDTDAHIKDYLTKMKHFDQPHNRDRFVQPGDHEVFESTVRRLRRLQRVVGYGRFNVIGFDNALRYARNYSRVGVFSPAEISFMEQIFHENATRYGFGGPKPLQEITHTVCAKDITKIPHTGHYLFKGKAEATYTEIANVLGRQLVLTSGVRGVMKQFLLFLNKAHANQGNLSLASRSLAPPGYSYHAMGDFDVGERRLGPYNFTLQFTRTKTYKKLQELGYLKLRYPADNLKGVRFEPWHIEIYPKTT